MSRRKRAIAAIAATLARGPWTIEAVEATLARIRGRHVIALRLFARVLVQSIRGRPRQRDIEERLKHSWLFEALLKRRRESWKMPEAAMLPAPAAQSWCVPEMTTAGHVADWLGITVDELLAMSRPWRERSAVATRQHHWHFQWIARRGRLPRLIEAPKARLKAVQHRILHGILENIPAHTAAHGFVRGRSIRTFTFPHAGQHCVLRMDVQDFFPSYRRAKVLRIFLNAGYPESVAAILANLCTTVAPPAVRDEGLAAFPFDQTWPLKKKLQSRHLPQGAPTSPSLANLCAFRLDTRLAGLAARFNARYTRYADDLLFSGGEDFARNVSRCAARVSAILASEGLAAAVAKTKIMTRSMPQRAAGLVMNESPNLPRGERELQEAILTNCAKHGPSEQNRSSHPDFRAHLLGKVAHAAHMHPVCGAKPRAIFDQIVWPDGA